MNPSYSNNALCKRVGENIEHFRLLKKKSVKEMAFILKLSSAAYRNIERGISDISITKLFKISDILHVTLFQLLNLEKDDNVLSNQELSSTDSSNKEVIEMYKTSIQQNKEEISFLRKQLQLFVKYK